VVHISAESLLAGGEEPGELEGYGPIDASTARALAAAAPSWQRLFEGPGGVPLSLGRSAYRPPKGLRRFIEYRDGTCQFPGCARPARRAEIDHITEWQDGGATDAANLQALCPRHHALKSLRLWTPTRLERDPKRGAHGEDAHGEAAIASGDILWTSPLGGRALAGPVDRELGPPRDPKQTDDPKQADGPDPPPF
jgi:hypothetical protein